MSRNRPGYGLLFCFALAACGGGTPDPGTAPAPSPSGAPAAAPAATPSDEPSTLDGVYTVAQAERGLEVFQNICSECHQTEEWTEDRFLARWDGESVFRFWYFIYERMPHGAPPYSLPRQTVTDVVTYIFQLNGLPPGSEELGADDESIDDYWLRWGTALP